MNIIRITSHLISDDEYTVVDTKVLSCENNVYSEIIVDDNYLVNLFLDFINASSLNIQFNPQEFVLSDILTYMYDQITQNVSGDEYNVTMHIFFRNYIYQGP